VPLFQEQLMQMAIAVGDCDAADADLLRRAMGSKRGVEKIEKLRAKLYAGMERNGIAPDVADAIYDKIEAFANFGFAESHAISFGLLVYASSWLKLHYPAAFLAALLRAQPMGFYSPHTLTADGTAFVAAKKMWRTDCKNLCTLTKGGPFGDYCKENPCGAPESVRAPRANWCPGSETAPLTAERIVRRVVPWPRAAARLVDLIEGVRQGLVVLRAPGRLILVVFWSFVLWLVNALAFYVGFGAFDIPVSYFGALLMQGLLVLGISIPSTPGFFGPFEAVIVAVLAFYGVPSGVAFSYAISFHITSFVPITLLGLWSLTRTPGGFQGLRQANL
jgi:hypothetical protein